MCPAALVVGGGGGVTSGMVGLSWGGWQHGPGRSGWQLEDGWW